MAVSTFSSPSSAMAAVVVFTRTSSG